MHAPASQCYGEAIGLYTAGHNRPTGRHQALVQQLLLGAINGGILAIRFTLLRNGLNNERQCGSRWFGSLLIWLSSIYLLPLQPAKLGFEPVLQP